MEKKKVQYRHNERDKIATLQNNNNYYTVENEHHPVAAWIIEGGNDWEKVTEPTSREKLLEQMEVEIKGWYGTGKSYKSLAEKALSLIESSSIVPVEEKKEEPVLITEDGKNILDGEDTIWKVWTDTWDKGSGKAGYQIPEKRLKLFSTEAARTEWILVNKPILSINDLMQYSDGETVDLDVEDIRRIGEAKLKQQ